MANEWIFTGAWILELGPSGFYFLLPTFCFLSANRLHPPNANLVAGMRWLLSTYTIRLNHRQQLFGHLFSGRYKAVIVEGSGNGYLRTACDYVHLNPVRAKLLGPRERLLEYPWSSLAWYLAAPEHRPTWMRVDRLLGEHGIQRDTDAGREECRHLILEAPPLDGHFKRLGDWLKIQLIILATILFG